MTHAIGIERVMEAIKGYWGEHRCTTFDADCSSCQAWAVFDTLSALKPSGDAGEVGRYAARADEMSEGGKYEWWSGLAAILRSQATLERQLATAREALEPFAAEADKYDPDDGDGNDMAWLKNFRIHQLRTARAALTPGVSDAE